jgi:hypothetical protein
MSMRQVADHRQFVHRIDAEDRICLVNDAWLAFANENGWRIDAAAVLGSDLMAHLCDPQTRHIYRLLIDRARDTAHSSRFHYRCDSPGLRRFMAMQVSPGDRGQVTFRSRVLRLERRDPIRVLDVNVDQRSNDTLQICSWCNSVCAASAWLRVEEAVQSLGIFSDGLVPRLSHGICPACSERMAGAGAAI